MNNYFIIIFRTPKNEDEVLQVVKKITSASPLSPHYQKTHMQDEKCIFIIILEPGILFDNRLEKCRKSKSTFLFPSEVGGETDDGFFIYETKLTRKEDEIKNHEVKCFVKLTWNGCKIDIF